MFVYQGEVQSLENGVFVNPAVKLCQAEKHSIKLLGERVTPCLGEMW